MKYLFFSIFLLFIYSSCKEEYIKPYEIIKHPRYDTQFGVHFVADGSPYIYDYAQVPPDTNGSFYQVSSGSLRILRYNANGGVPEESFIIAGFKIHLDQLIYPTIFYPKNYQYVQSHPSEQGIYVFHMLPYDAYSSSTYDSSLFTITFQSFINDTLIGAFNGILRKNGSSQNDTTENITYGEFKIAICRVN